MTKKLTDFKQDAHNLNKHTEHGHGLTRKSVDKFGPRRPLEVDKHGTIIDGNDRQEIYVDTEQEPTVRVVKAEPGEVIVVQYDDFDLTDPTNPAREYQAALHKSAVASFNLDVEMASLHMGDGLDLSNWWADWELSELGLIDEERFVPAPKLPNPRQLPVDVIYTLQMADCTCCLAIQAGLKYGIQSAKYRLCPYVGKLSDRHLVAFIDNDYLDYNHQVHLDAVKELRPKYATVRDIMTKQQCEEAGIEHYELGQIIEWGEELLEYAEHVILIPKYDCLADLPDKFVLGYSIPTSHGGTPLPAEWFKDWRVHLLGGSWKKQLEHLKVLGHSVISIDNNYVQHQSQYGSFVYPDGKSGQLTETLGLDYLKNTRYVALALSFGAIGAKINELWPSNTPTA